MDPSTTQMVVSLFATEVIYPSQIIGEVTGMVTLAKDRASVPKSRRVFPLTSIRTPPNAPWLYLDSSVMGNEVSRVNDYREAGMNQPNAKFVQVYGGMDCCIVVGTVTDVYLCLYV